MADKGEGPERNTELTWLLDNERVGASGNPGAEFLYRPEEILVVEEDLDAELQAELAEWGTYERDEEDERESSALSEIGVRRLGLPRDVDVGAVVSSVRRRREGRVPRVGPNHLLIGEPPYHGGPGHNLSPGPSVELVHPTTLRKERRVTVGVLDTGVRTGHQWLGNYDVSGVGPDFDEDTPARLDADSNQELDRQAGHGTFVAGIILQQAPAASVRVCSVLDSNGVGDDASVVAGINSLLKSDEQVDILNLSLGGYTHDNLPPVALRELIAKLLSKGTVVVAAAGNNADSRPFWPAAFKRVIAVAALTRDGQSAAPFTNHGWWVDACAPGVELTSTFVEWSDKVTTLGAGQTYEFDGWATWGGTSFAAPLVAGAIAARAASEGVDATRAAFECVGAAGLEFRPNLGVVANLARPLPPLPS